MPSPVGIALPGANEPLWERPAASLHSHRTTRTWVEVLDASESVLGTLAGVESGDVEGSIGLTARRSGSIDVAQARPSAGEIPLGEVDWASARLRPWRQVEGLDPWPLGVYLPEMPEQAWDGWHETRRIDLVGKLVALADDLQPRMVTYPAGTVVTTAVREQLVASGQPGAAVTDSTETLRSPMTWDPNTSRLRIINDLLDSIGYSALWDDGHGIMHADPYVRPAQRPIAYDLLDDERSIYTPAVTITEDVGSIPNRVIATASAEGLDDPLVAVWENRDPASPYSIPSRGRVIPFTEDAGEVTSQKVLDEYARRRGIEKSSATRTVQVTIGPVPIDLSEAVRWRHMPSGTEARHVVTAWRVPLEETGLASLTLREVVDL